MQATNTNKTTELHTSYSSNTGGKKSFSKKWASFKSCAGVRCLFHTTDTTTAFLSKISEESRRNTAARLSTLKCALNK